MSETTGPSESAFQNVPPPSPGDDDDVSLLDLLLVMVKHKKVMVAVPLAAAVAAIIYSLLLPNIYTATTKVLPPPQNQTNANAMLAQLGAFVGATPAKSANDLYIGMLKSRTVADNLIKRFDLAKLREAKYASQLRDGLAAATDITSGKDGIITINVEDRDPRLAADLANGYVDELLKLTQVLAVTEASQRRLFFEQQFSQARENLAKAEASARRGLERRGLVKVDEQGRAMIEATARLRGQITVKEVQIGAMRTFAAEHNPELQRAEQELQVMKLELAKIEGEGGLRSATKDVAGSGGMDSLRLLRDVKYNEVLYELLAKQYEMAKIDEARDSAVIQVLDKAIEPDRKSKPKRTVIVLLWTFVAAVLTMVWVFVRESMARASSDPRQSAKLEALRRFRRWR